MQIILMHPRWVQGKHFTLTSRHIACALIFLLASILTAATLLFLLVLHSGAEARLPFLQEARAAVKQEETNVRPRHVNESMAVMAVKLGDIQARMMRLDSLGERVQNLAGISPEAFNFNEIPGRGGLERVGLSRDSEPERMVSELWRTMDVVITDLEHRSDYLNAVEAALMHQKGGVRLMPTIQPVNGAYNSSPFGMRADPFTGVTAFHEGVDFAAPEGTPVVAAAGGVVVAAGEHDQYGNMVDISHGNDITTRYAHASRLLVRRGDIVRRGQHIADVGSTGRSTGAHLHFEVQVKNVAQNPHAFLSTGTDPIQLADRAPN